MILPPPLCESKSVLKEFANAGVAVVSIASGRFSHEVSCVRIDDFHASKEMTAYLIAQGHTCIGYIKGHTNQTASTHRYEGFQAALAEAGIGANLQHYNPLIDNAVAEAWDIPASWRLRAEMVFGGIAAPAGEKAFAPLEGRFKVHGA